MSNIRKNYTYNVIYQLLLIIIPLVLSPYISRVLGPQGVGEYSYTQSIANYFVLFGMLGVNNYGNRTVAMHRDDKEKLSLVFWNIYALQLIVSLISISIYFIFIIIFGNDFLNLFLLQSIYVISCAFDVNWFFFGMEEFKITVSRNIIIRIISVVCIFIFVNTNDDVFTYTLIMASSVIFSQIALWPFIFKFIKIKKPSISGIKEHILPYLYLFIPIIATSLYKIMDKIMIGSLYNVQELGYYANAEKIINIPMGLITALGVVMLPKMSNLLSKGDFESNKSYIEKSMIFVMFLGTAISFGILGIAKDFAPLFFGVQFQTTGTIIMALTPTILLISWANVIRTQFLIPTKRDRIYIKSVIIGAVINLTLNFIFIPLFGAFGAAIGTVAAEFSVALIQTIATRKYLEYKKYISNSIPFFISGLVMYLVVWIISLQNIDSIYKIFIQIIIGAATYFISIFIIYKLFKNNNLISELIHKLSN